MEVVKSRGGRAPVAGRGSLEGPPDRRTEILSLAAHVFFTRGYRGSSLENVAEQIGFKRQAIYHYFSSKEHLLYEILRLAMNAYITMRSQVLASTRNPLERVLRLIRAQVMAITSRDYSAEITILVDSEIHELTPEHREEIKEMWRSGLHTYHGLLDELKRQGHLRDLDTSVATLSLQSLVTGVARWYRRDGALSPEQIADQITTTAAGFLLTGEVVDDLQRLLNDAKRWTEQHPL